MSNPLINLARSEVREMTPYSSARSENRSGGIILNANENNYTLSGYESYNRYPYQQPQNLVQKFSELYGVSPEQILITRGSDEAIDLLIRVFCQAGQDKIIICPPTYGMYAISAITQGAKIVEVPLLKEQNFALDMAAIKSTWEPSIKLVFLCSPNNPTGNLFSPSDILSICEGLKNKALVVVDEAYIEFAKQTSMVDFMAKCPNLIVLRTLSKLYALAGLRCGVAIAQPDIIQLLRKVLAPYPVPVPVVDIVNQYLTADNLHEIKNNLKIILEQRQQLYEFLKTLRFVKEIWPSEANFILFLVDDAQAIIEHCQHQGIIIRDRSRDYGLKNCVRISIGTPEQNEKLKRALENV